jgi:hypothetical protein
MKFLTFYYFMQKFSDYNFYWVNFFAFVSTYLNSAFYYTHIQFLQTNCFAFTSTENETAEQTKNMFYNVSYNPILHPFPVWEASFCPKNLKSLCPTVQYTVQVHAYQAPSPQPRPHNFPASVSNRREKAEI